MGTNWFYRRPACDHCGRADPEVHVCKSGMTWRAYPNKLLSDEHPDWGFERESPFGFPVLSLADWRTVFTTVPGELWNEYGEKIPDPVAWLDGMKPLDDAAVARYRGWHWRDLASGDDWFDADGFFFTSGEFS